MAPKFDRFQIIKYETTANIVAVPCKRTQHVGSNTVACCWPRGQHCCGSMQTDATCWVQHCCMLLATRPTLLWFYANGRNMLGPTLLHAVGHEANIVVVPCKRTQHVGSNTVARCWPRGQHCGSMQTGATCWVQYCCMLLATRPTLLWLHANGRNMLGPTLLHAVGHEANIVVVLCKRMQHVGSNTVACCWPRGQHCCGSMQTGATLLRYASPVTVQYRNIAPKFHRFQIIRNKCQYRCGSMQTGATCWAQQSSKSFIVCQQLNGRFQNGSDR